jgi:Tol biopolymer transport system component
VRRAPAVLLAVAAGLSLAGAAGSAGRPKPTGTILFQRVVPNPIGYQVFRVNADGTGLTQLTRGAERVDNGEPEASPDGRSIVFQHGPHEGNMEIYLMRSDGSRMRRLTHCAGCHWSIDASFSPDGSSIVFARWGAQGVVAIWRMRVGGTNARILVRPGKGRPRDQPNSYPMVLAPKVPFVDQPAFSPDGRFLAYRGTTLRGQTSIFVATADGRNARAATPPSVHASRPRWSPDGKLILFYTTDKDDLHPGRSANIEAIHPDGTGLHALTHDRGGSDQNYDADWSPDGNWIVFARATNANKPPGSSGSAEIYLMRADGTDMRRLVAGGFNQLPAWGASR